jgi:hypothetical protein
MKCPNCKNIDLVLSERQNVEIDYCPTCRGVWLDRGELDKIIEKIESGNTDSNNTNPQMSNQQLYYGKHGGGHGRKSFWREIFD